MHRAKWIPLFLDQIDLIYEGIETCNGRHKLIPTNCWTKLTWFMKGLRPVMAVNAAASINDQIDLIYEGIETLHQIRCNLFHKRPNWPDLWRDWDKYPCSNAFAFTDQIDLIYEGIETQFHSHFVSLLVCSTKLTWFMKGLRLYLNIVILCQCSTKLTWFMKGLRPFCGLRFLSSSWLTKLTWFMKGLRLHFPPPFFVFFVFDQIDLIYEGIETLEDPNLDRK